MFFRYGLLTIEGIAFFWEGFRFNQQGVALLRGHVPKSRGLGWNSALHGSAIAVHVSQQRFCTSNTSK